MTEAPPRFALWSWLQLPTYTGWEIHGLYESRLAVADAATELSSAGNTVAITHTTPAGEPIRPPSLKALRCSQNPSLN
jgi:hypothetical protein